MILRKDFSFDAAHRLSFHTGQCKNLHGHTWKGFVEVSCTEKVGELIIDFGEISSYIKSNFDHKVLVFKGDPVFENAMQIMNTPYKLLDKEATAENISELICQDVGLMVAKKVNDPFARVKVGLWESDNNYVETSTFTKE